jgi:hypothetical protein
MMLANSFVGNAGPFPSPFPSSLRTDTLGAFLDPRRDIDAECGYPDITDTIPVEMFRRLYDREPIAARVVDLYPKESWQTLPTVYEDEDADDPTEFETAWDELNQTLMPNQSWFQDELGSPIWETLIRADILSGIGHFGLILLGLDDGRNLQEPVDGVITVNKGVPMHDCFVTQRDYDQIMSQEKLSRKQQVWNTSTKQFEEKEVSVYKPWSEREKAEILNWREGGKLVENKLREIVANQTRPVSEKSPTAAHLDAFVSNGTQNVLHDPFPFGRNPNEPTPFDMSNRGPGMSTKDGQNLGTFGPRDPPALSSGYGPGPYPESAGTDRQFQGEGWGIGMPPPFAVVDATAPGRGQADGDRQRGQSASPSGYSLSGVDQQYFGVQFGPSEQPADTPSKKKTKLLFLRVYDESLIQVVRYEWNIRNPRFGFPVMYRITLNDPREVHSGIGLPIATVFVHWSRVVHLADNRMSSEIFGVPRMRPVLNRLLDLRKVYGSDAEAFWKNVVMKLSLETHPQMGGDVEIDEPGLADMMENYQNSLQNYMVLRGMSAKTVSPAVVAVKDHIDCQIEAICVKLGCPVRVFRGSERGELASSQDDAAWNDRLRFRQNAYITPRIISPFIDRLIQIGVLPEPEGYTVKWPDLDSVTDKDKAQIALQETQALGAFVAQGIEQVMQPEDYMIDVLEWDEERVDEIMQAAEKKQQEEQDEAEDLADEHGFIPQPPEGFQNKPQPPIIKPPMGGPGLGAGGLGGKGAGGAAMPGGGGAGNSSGGGGGKGGGGGDEGPTEPPTKNENAGALAYQAASDILRGGK